MRDKQEQDLRGASGNNRPEDGKMRTIEELSRTIDTLNRSLKAVTFRNLAVIAILILLGLPTYVSFWLMKLENRTVLWDLFGQSKVVRVVGDCPTVRTVGVDGKAVYTTYITYRQMPAPFIVAIIRPSLSDDLVADAEVCQQLMDDRDKILGRYKPVETVPTN